MEDPSEGPGINRPHKGIPIRACIHFLFPLPLKAPITLIAKGKNNVGQNDRGVVETQPPQGPWKYAKGQCHSICLRKSLSQG